LSGLLISSPLKVVGEVSWNIARSALLLFLLRSLHGSVRVYLGQFLPEEFVNLVVGREYLTGLRPASLVASGGLYLDGVLNPERHIPGNIVSQLSVMEDDVCQELLPPVANFLSPLSICAYIKM
jgi:hypothetical protein